MRDMLKEALKAPNVIDSMTMISYEPLNLSGEQLTALQRADSAKIAKLVSSLPK
jgi:tripartite-type tricarboxylate transporter receptor subunit TctC